MSEINCSSSVAFYKVPEQLINASENIMQYGNKVLSDKFRLFIPYVSGGNVISTGILFRKKGKNKRATAGTILKKVKQVRYCNPAW
jgi:hypothetical protein